MKKITLLLGWLLTLAAGAAPLTLSAQSETNNGQWMIVMRTTAADGSEHVTRKPVRDKEEALRLLRDLKGKEGQYVDLEFYDPRTGRAFVEEGTATDDGETILYFRRARRPAEEKENPDGDQGPDVLRLSLHGDLDTPWEGIAETTPCRPFIGVTLHGLGDAGSGVRVSRVIAGTPAEAARLREGDRITAIDGSPVESYDELLRQRDKYRPGDAFTLSIDREGESLLVEARFPACDAAGTPTGLPGDDPDNAAPGAPLRQLEYRVFPNPSAGHLTVQFRGEAAPLTVQLTGAGGQVLFREFIRDFDGDYQRRIDLRDARPGLYILQIRQNGEVRSEKVVVTPRA